MQIHFSITIKLYLPDFLQILKKDKYKTVVEQGEILV